MSPRFVELNKPVQTGIALILEYLSWLAEGVGGFAPESVTCDWTTALLFNGTAEKVLHFFPHPRAETVRLTAMSAVAMAAHMIYVMLRARSMLRCFSSARKPSSG